MKKGIAILLIAILVIDLTSCASYKQLSTQQDYEIYQNKRHIQVLKIMSKKDSIIIFNEKYPGKLENKQVYGIRQRQFPHSASDSIIFTTQDQNTAYISKNGALYKIVSQDKSGFICISPDTIRTPFSNVTLMDIKMKDPVKTTLTVLGLSILLIGITGFVLSSGFSDWGLGGY